MVDESVWVILPENASPNFLVSFRCFPRLVDVVVWVLLELRAVLSNVLALAIVLFVERDRRVDPEILIEEATCGQPLPVGVVDGPVCVNELPLKDLGAGLPVLPEVAPG